MIHVHSNFSSGDYLLEQLVEKAQKKGIDVLVLTDHDLVEMQYGLFPFRNFIKYSRTMKSVSQAGPDKFLAEISRINQMQNKVVVVPGVQCSPFYYWTGNPLKSSLCAHDYRKELLLIGMDSAADYKNIPVLHGNISTRYARKFLPQFLFFLAPFVLSVFASIKFRGAFRKAGVVTGLISLAFLIDSHPLKSSAFDPYHGDQGVWPYQEVIDYVNEKQGLTYWAHPDSKFSVKGQSYGPITLKTKRYSQDLINSAKYTGFSGLYGDTSTAILPGRQWDQALLQYCKGKRKTPAWTIAGADFHNEKSGILIDTFQTIFLTNDKSITGVLKALANGRNYAVRKSSNYRLCLDSFRVVDLGSKLSATMGGRLAATSLPQVEGEIIASDGNVHPIDVVIIKNGQVWRKFKGETPCQFLFQETDLACEKSYFRLDITGETGHRVITNPIFVSRVDGFVKAPSTALHSLFGRSTYKTVLSCGQKTRAPCI